MAASVGRGWCCCCWCVKRAGRRQCAGGGRLGGRGRLRLLPLHVICRWYRGVRVIGNASRRNEGAGQVQEKPAVSLGTLGSCCRRRWHSSKGWQQAGAAPEPSKAAPAVRSTSGRATSCWLAVRRFQMDAAVDKLPEAALCPSTVQWGWHAVPCRTLRALLMNHSAAHWLSHVQHFYAKMRLPASNKFPACGAQLSLSHAGMAVCRSCRRSCRLRMALLLSALHCADR